MIFESEERPTTRRPRRNHGQAFEAKVALAASQGEKTLAELPSSSMFIYCPQVFAGKHREG